MVIPRFVLSALKNEPISIFGDGNQTRVFCHVSDASLATMLLARNNNSIGEVFNIGGITEISILDLANEIVKQLNSNSIVAFKNYSEAYKVGYEDIQRRVPDISKIKNLTGWEPKKNLTTIISDVAKSLLIEI
jgi:UDP-glucose 4-epimerase